MDYDLVIIGGGVSGLGVALAAIKRGLRVALFERGAFGQETSNNSLRIMHGGIRYLQSGNLLRTAESLRDQHFIAKSFPEAVAPLACLLPISWSGVANPLSVSALSLGYSLISRGLGLGGVALGVRQRVELTDLPPLFDGKLFFNWPELLLVDHAQLVCRLVEQLRGQGVVIEEGAGVTRVELDESGATVLVGERSVTASKVIDASGPWIGSIPGTPRLWQGGWCRAINLLVRRDLTGGYGVGFFGGKRAYFMVPRGEHTAIGTWYEVCEQPTQGNAATDRGGGGANLAVDSPLVERFLLELNTALPALRLEGSDIFGLDQGVLPLNPACHPKKESTTALVTPLGRERILSQGSYVALVSSKYTTFRSFGERVLKSIFPTKG